MNLAPNGLVQRIFSWIFLNWQPWLHIPHKTQLPWSAASTSHCAAVSLLGGVPPGGRFIRIRISSLRRERVEILTGHR